MSSNQQLENQTLLAIKLGQWRASSDPNDLARDLGKLQKLSISLYKRREVGKRTDAEYAATTAFLEGRALELARGLGLACTIEPGDYPVRLVINGLEHWVF